MSYSYAIGMNCAGSVKAGAVHGLLDCRLHSDPLNRVILRESPPLLDVERNKVIFDFFDGDGEPEDVLLFVDSDIVFDHTQAERIVERAASNPWAVWSGVYCNVFGDDTFTRPVLFRHEYPEDGDVKFKTAPYTFDDLDALPTFDGIEGCKVVDTAGAGFLAIHKRVFTLMVQRYGKNHPWFRCVDHFGVITGEDVGFCLRLKNLGIPVVTDTQVRVGHIKTIAYQ